jgi:hypothetical protein
MKVYRPGDSIQPIRVNLQTVDDPGGLSPWVTGTALIAMSIVIWIIPQDRPSSLLSTQAMILLGFSLALVFFGLALYSRRIPALARFGSRHRLAINVTGITVVTLAFGSLLLSFFVSGGWILGVLILLGFVLNFGDIPLWLLERRNARRIAAEMRAQVRQETLPVAPAPAAKVKPATPGELLIEFYDVSDLPSPKPLRDRVTAESNIVGLPPCRFLHLYNFFADEISQKPRPLTAWRLHGPVAMLGSPLELARLGSYSLALPHSITSQLMNDAEKLQTRLSGLTDAPLPPEPLSRFQKWKLQWLQKAGQKTGLTLPLNFADSGAYPEELLLCNDETWKAAVEGLTSRSAKVVIDAAEFSPERHGLIWEIQHVIDHFATENMVVLVNSFTDLPALAEEFRRAWGNMAATSANNLPGEARLRIVMLIGDDKGGFDDDSALGGRPDASRDWERLSAHHRVMTLLRESESGLRQQDPA